MAFKYFRADGRDGVWDDEKKIGLHYINSGPEAPREFRLSGLEKDVLLYLRDATKKPTEQRKKLSGSLSASACLKRW